jgi:hypothetical protein
LLVLFCVADRVCTCQIASPIEIPKVPPTANCVIISSGNCTMLAATNIQSNGDFLSMPNLFSACIIFAFLKGCLLRLLLPSAVNSGTISTPFTIPVTPTIWASNAGVRPEPAPMSSIFSPACGASFSNIKVTVVG